MQAKPLRESVKQYPVLYVATTYTGPRFHPGRKADCFIVKPPDHNLLYSRANKKAQRCITPIVKLLLHCSYITKPFYNSITLYFICHLALSQEVFDKTRKSVTIHNAYHLKSLVHYQQHKPYRYMLMLKLYAQLGLLSFH